jgi:hypothetical protein
MIANLSGFTRTPLTELSVTSRGEALAYRQVTDLNAFTYDVRAELQRRFSPRFTAMGRLGAQRRRSADVAIGDQDFTGGVSVPTLLPLLPFVRSQTVEGSLDGAYRVSATATGRMEGAYTRTTYDSPVLIGGSTATVDASLRTQVTPADAVISTLDARRVHLEGRGVWLHTLTEGWDHRTPSFGVTADVGAALVLSDSAHRRAVSPVGRVRLTSLSTNGALSLGYGHTVSQAFGVGLVLIVDDVNASYTHIFPSDTRLEVSADQGWSTDIESERSRLASTHLTTTVEQVLPGGVSVGAHFVKRRRDDIVRVDASGLSVFARFQYGERRR